MVIPLILLFSNSALVAGTLADADRQRPASGFVTARMQGANGLAARGVRIARSTEEWPYAL
jgi:hypothetical protein